MLAQFVFAMPMFFHYLMLTSGTVKNFLQATKGAEGGEMDEHATGRLRHEGVDVRFQLLLVINNI